MVESVWKLQEKIFALTVANVASFFAPLQTFLRKLLARLNSRK